MTRLPDIDGRMYMIQALNSFIGDPPDSNHQIGYLGALLEVWRHGFGFDTKHDVYQKAYAIYMSASAEEGGPN